jgi:hypothetical protein
MKIKMTKFDNLTKNMHKIITLNFIKDIEYFIL